MKRFLPNSKPSGFTTFSLHERGFTLIELLVVVSIIAILAVIGMVMLGGLQGKARDTERRAEVDAILKAYEIKHDAATGKYPNKDRIVGSDFADGKIPTPPNDPNEEYKVILENDNKTIRVCAALEDGTSPCDATSPTCYCKLGAQGSTGTANTPPPQCNDDLDNETPTPDGKIDFDGGSDNGTPDPECDSVLDNNESS